MPPTVTTSVSTNPPRWGILILVFGLALVAIGLAVNASLLFNLLAPPAARFPSPFPVLNSPLHAGDTLILQVTRCAWDITGDDPVRVTTTRSLVSADSPTIVVLPSVDVDIPTGCQTVQSRLNIIPDDLPPGRWRLQGSNTARNKTVPFSSEPFVVLGP
jgi:hypothetical protein